MSEPTEPSTAGDAPPGEPALSGIHTASFAQLLDQIGCSIAVTTYQAGKLVLLRPQRGESKPLVNTHFRTFSKPMGFAREGDRFALGTLTEIREFHNMPEKGEPRPLHDAAFLPRLCHTTGDIAIHEMVWVPNQLPSTTDPSRRLSELWFVNTRFSCLATRDEFYSFVPRWVPPFISRLAADDRCHLNGVCLRDGRVRYVTALASTDTSGGWREHKRDGGIVMDVTTNQILARGLTMPHSPRWHDGKLWVLESGKGGIGIIDPATGAYEEICRLPGFTRGFDFAGPFAFVGLSQVRESATFSGIEIADLPQERRCCGVWAVDTRSGKIAGYVKFIGAVSEIFAVQVLAGLRWPEVFSEDPQRIASTYRVRTSEVQR